MSSRRCDHDTTISTVRDIEHGQPVEYQVCDRCNGAVGRGEKSQ